MKIVAAAIVALSFSSLWFTPDQMGKRLFEKENFAEAAKHFQDPLWKGTALYRAGEFEEAAAVFSRSGSPKAHFNRGNCLAYMGKYDDAIKSYETALEKRPGWKEAEENRDLAAARAEMIKQEGGDMGDQKIGADEIVFDKKKEGGQDTDTTGDDAENSDSMQSIWLRRVQTKPADFLRRKFAYQNLNPEAKEEP